MSIFIWTKSKIVMVWRMNNYGTPSELDAWFIRLIPTIFPEGLAQEIVCRMLGNRFLLINDMQNAFCDMSPMQIVINVF